VYYAESVAYARVGNPVIALAKCVDVLTILDVAHQDNDRLYRFGPLRGQPASVFDAACPIYLRTLSLRI
jgi:hypothetical protein